MLPAVRQIFRIRRESAWLNLWPERINQTSVAVRPYIFQRLKNAVCTAEGLKQLLGGIDVSKPRRINAVVECRGGRRRCYRMTMLCHKKIKAVAVQMTCDVLSETASGSRNPFMSSDPKFPSDNGIHIGRQRLSDHCLPIVLRRQLLVRMLGNHGAVYGPKAVSAQRIRMSRFLTDICSVKSSG